MPPKAKAAAAAHDSDETSSDDSEAGSTNPSGDDSSVMSDISSDSDSDDASVSCEEFALILRHWRAWLQAHHQGLRDSDEIYLFCDSVRAHGS